MGFVIKLFFLPSFLLAKERAVQRSVDRVSKSARGVHANALASIHPDIASLVDPLFAARKEGELQFLLSFLPAFLLAKERAGKCF